MGSTRTTMLSVLVALAPIAAACAGGTPTAAPQATATQPAAATETAATETAATETTVVALAAIKEATAVPTEAEELAATSASTVSSRQAATGGTRIQVVVGDDVLTGQLWDNAAARDLVSQLPLTLPFRDFNSLEKIARLPRKLSTTGLPAGDDPSPNEIGYYAPWGDLVFYYGDVGYFDGIVRIGQFDGSMDAHVNQAGDFTATIELAN